MSRLFLRIWLTFWAVLAAAFAVAAAVDYGLALQRASNVNRLSPQALAEWGAQEIRAGGEASGRHWLLMMRTRMPELQAFVVAPDGRELGGQSPAEVARALARPRGGSPFPAEVTERLDGRPYRFVFQRAHAVSFDVWDILLQPWVLAGLMLALSGAGAAWLARSLTGPIQRLQGRVQAIAAGDLDSRIVGRLTRRRDELGALARDIDHMAGRLQALIAAREAMLRDVSHELRAPLARLRAVADLARKRGGESPTLQRIDKEIDRLDGLIGQILRFSRLQAAPDLALERLELLSLVEEVAADARLEGAAAGKSVVLQSTERASVLADPGLIRSAIENVLRNAIRFSPEGECVEIVLAAAHGKAQLDVLDRGPGVGSGELARIFEPFHGEGAGAGLGLAISQRVLNLHGGGIAAMNRPGGGLAVRIVLPCDELPSQGAASAAGRRKFG